MQIKNEEKSGNILMVIKMLLASLLAFFTSVGIGKVFIPWMEKRRYTQPLKDEVAEMYNEKAKEEAFNK